MSAGSKGAIRRHAHPATGKASVDVARLLQRAANALVEGQPDLACQLLAQAPGLAANLPGRDLQLAAFVGQAWARWDKPARALEALERASKLAPDDHELARLRGTLLRRLGRFRVAAAQLEQACRSPACGEDVALELVLTRLAAGDRGAQLSAVAKGVGLTGAVGAAVLALAEGDLGKATRGLAESREPAAELVRAIALVAWGENNAGLSALAKIAAKDALPRAARAFAGFYLGLAQVRLRQLEAAAESLRQAVDLGLPGELARAPLAWVQNQLVMDAVLDGNLDVAWGRLALLIDEDDGPQAEAARDNVVYALTVRGQDKARAGEYGEAATLWSRALTLRPGDFVVRQNLAVALERAHRGDEAIPHWHELVQQLEKASGKSAKRGRDARQGSDEDGLRRHVRAVAHRHLADLYVEDDDVERARMQMERALEALPEDIDIRYALAKLVYEEGEPRKAVAHLERVIADRPDWVEALAALGRIRGELADFDGAAAALERAYALEPANPVVRLNLGTVIARRVVAKPAPFDAEGNARRALGLLPRAHVDGSVALAAALFAKGKRKEAISALRKLVREAGDQVVAAIEAGRCYWKAGEQKLAVQVWERTQNKPAGRGQALPALARVWAEVGDLERCRGCFEKLLQRPWAMGAVGAAEGVMALPQGKALLNRVLKELIPAASGSEERVFIVDGLLKTGDMQAARALIGEMAADALDAGDARIVNFVAVMNYRYRYKLLDRGAARAVEGWLDEHEPEHEDDDD